MNPTSPPRVRPVGISDYVRASAILAVFGCGLWLALRTAAGSPAAEALLAPVTALVALTGVVWLVMVVVRNLTILRGITRPEYFRDYTTHSPAEWVERPARTFNNLLQVPILFYLGCVLMLITRGVDAGQLALAWIYVATRLVHAVVYIGWNDLTLRFTSWAASCITLAVLWFRLAQQLP